MASSSDAAPLDDVAHPEALAVPPGGSTTTMAIARVAEGADPGRLSADSMIQRADEDALTDPGLAAGGVTGVVAAAAPGAQLGERELEALLGRLYPKIRTQLSRELLIARERSGLLVDLS